MLTTDYVIDALTSKSVTIKTQKYYNNTLVEQHSCSYINSDRSRTDLQNDVPAPQVNAVFSVWGDIATIDDTVTDFDDTMSE